MGDTEISPLAEAARRGAQTEELLDTPVPGDYLAAHLRREDERGQEGEIDVRSRIRIGQVPMPELAPDEALVAVMASGINYNTVWSAMGRPVSTFRFLEQLGKKDHWSARHDLNTQVIGSDASGIIVRLGSLVTGWTVGDQVVIHPITVDPHDHASFDDGMMSAGQMAWGFETNFGGLAHFSVVKAHQLLPKSPHLTWEEAAANTLCATTCYRMLVSQHGARMRQGDIVLIWGAAGGLGGYAIQFVRNGGGIPVGVVGSAEKAELVREMGCDLVIDRSEIAARHDSHENAARQLGRRIRQLAGEDPHIVFDYVGQETFPASVFLARRGGTVITCGSSTGYMHQFDNRYLWMRLKRIIGSHAANYQEAWETNRLISLRRLVPTLSEVYPLAGTGEAARKVQLNKHVGKVGVLVLAAEEGLGVQDLAARDALDEKKLNAFRRYASASSVSLSCQLS